MARLYKNQWEWLSQILLSTKIIECYHLWWNAVVVEHLGDTAVIIGEIQIKKKRTDYDAFLCVFMFLLHYVSFFAEKQF